MKYKGIIFDLDGTLLDTLEDLAAAVDKALGKRGFPLHPLEEYCTMVGHGVRNLCTQALPKEYQADEALIDTVLADFKASYSAHIDVKTRPYPGMRELLGRLRDAGVQTAVASNKFQEGTERLIRSFFPEIPFIAILGNRPGFPLKPDPEIVQEVLRKSGLRPDEVALVGDSATDMKTAENGGIQGIAVAWGYRRMGPDAPYPVAATPEQLEKLL